MCCSKRGSHFSTLTQPGRGVRRVLKSRFQPLLAQYAEDPKCEVRLTASQFELSLSTGPCGLNPPQTPRPRSRGCDNARFTEGKTEAEKSKGWPTSPTWRAAALGQEPRPEPHEQGPDLKGPFLCTAAYTQRAITTCGTLLLPAFHPRICEPAFPRPGVQGREARAGEGQPDDVRPQFPLWTADTQHPADRAVTPAPDRSSLTGPVAREAPSRGTKAPSPQLTSRAAEPRPSDGCACAPRRHPAPPPSRDACAEGTRSCWISFCACASIVQAGVGEVTQFRGGNVVVVRATDLCDRRKTGSQDCGAVLGGTVEDSWK